MAVPVGKMNDKELEAEKNRLQDKLDRLWNWMAINSGDPDYPGRSKVFDSTLKRYERVCDRLQGTRRNES